MLHIQQQIRTVVEKAWETFSTPVPKHEVEVLRGSLWNRVLGFKEIGHLFYDLELEFECLPFALEVWFLHLRANPKLKAKHIEEMTSPLWILSSFAIHIYYKRA